MSVEGVERSIEAPDANLENFERQEVIWNGRMISLINANQNPNIKVCSYAGSICRDPEPSSPLFGYFDSEKKKQNKFDVLAYQYHIRCNNEESKKALYPNNLKSWIFGCAKATQFADHKWLHISNIRPFMIDKFRQLSRCPKPIFEVVWV